MIWLSLQIVLVVLLVAIIALQAVVLRTTNKNVAAAHDLLARLRALQSVPPQNPTPPQDIGAVVTKNI